MKTNIALILIAGILLNGCSSFGPNTVQNDRMGYMTTISESLKTQMLLNLVKLRYGDMPVFLDVSSIINQYTLAGIANLDNGWNTHPYSASTALGFSAQYADRPTITYTPQTGDKFTRSLLTPIPPSVVFNFLQAGRSPDLLLHISVQSMNGIQNARLQAPPDPRFERIVQLITKMQQTGGVVVKFGDGNDKGTTYLIVTNPDDTNVTADRTELRRILKLDPEATEISIVYGASPANDRQVAIVTRSVFDIMAQVAVAAEVPQKDIDEGRATPSTALLRDSAYKPLAQIHYSREKPKDAAIMVQYRGLWFWIDDRDLRSKGMFTVLLLMVNLAESGQPTNAPLVTIPAG
jgi:hypothetical protein